MDSTFRRVNILKRNGLGLAETSKRSGNKKILLETTQDWPPTSYKRGYNSSYPFIKAIYRGPISPYL